MSPEYFHNALTFGEADDYLGGMNRRCRHGYAQARMVQSIIGQLFAKDYKVTSVPRFMIIDRQGKVFSYAAPAPKYPQLKQLILKALKN